MNPAMVGALMGAGKGIAQGDDIKGIAKKAAIGGVTGFAGGQGLNALGSSGLTPAAENIPTLLTEKAGGAITPNFADKALNFATTAPDNLANYVSDGFADMSFADKLTLGLTGVSALPDNSQEFMPVGGNNMVARGGPYQPNLLETNVPGMQTAQRELTDEEKILLMQQNNSLLG